MFANRIKMWKGKENTNTLLFSLKGFEIYNKREEDKRTP
jgi:hypothetical protein